MGLMIGRKERGKSRKLSWKEEGKEETLGL